MRMTIASGYALRVVTYMAKKNSKNIFMRSELSKECDIPDSFLGKILQSLTKSNILSSIRGKYGGYKLAKNIEDITIYDVIIAVEGENFIYLNKCLFDNNFCKHIKECTIRKALKKINNNFIKELKSYNIKSLI
ncbi:MAG: Rrf2 family transcriptional regulator [Deferribacterota bacterium]|nr:Rrf2 family transcriptional regulator [Deferribacterota bacterium]